jgi:heparosan-N-sulfate-glucuronate 5-epimerase
MTRFRENLDNLLEYFGKRSRNYSHSGTAVVYDPNDPLAYYLDPSPRVDYPGPYDSDGIPLYVRKDVTDYLPVNVCIWALGHLERYRQTKNENCRSQFLKAVRWLISHQSNEGVWLTHFSMSRFGLHKPFPSAMVQGLSISCLIRAFLLTEEPEFLDRARLALSPFHRDIREGGVASFDEGFVFYEEFPSIPYRHVLNGFIFALWGLYDLGRMKGHQDAERLYEHGIETLIEWLPRYDLGYWSLYHIGAGPKNPATVPYHRLHIAQLRVMHTITGVEIFNKYCLLWKSYLVKRFNAVRTLPAKVRWVLSKSPRS